MIFCYLFQSGTGDPSRRMVRVSLAHRLEQQTSLFNVVYVAAIVRQHRLQVRQVALRIDHSLSAHRIASLRQLHVHQSVTRLADFLHVNVTRGRRQATEARLQAAELLVARVNDGCLLRHRRLC